MIKTKPTSAMNNEVLKLLENYLAEIKSSDDYLEFVPRIESLIHSANSPLMVMIMGEFKTGKSTFINAILEKEVLKSDVTPATAVVTKISYAQKENLKAIFQDGKIIEYPVEKLAEITAEGDDSKVELRSRIKYVELQLPLELLKKINIIDTPGLNVDNDLHIQSTKEFMHTADAVLWLFAYGKTASKTELASINELGERLKPIAVVNRIDEIDEEDETVEEALSDVKERLGDSVESVYGVSALHAKKGLKMNKLSLLEECGWSNFRSDFDSRIVAESKKLKEMSLGKQLNDLVDELSKFNEGFIIELDRLSNKYNSIEKNKSINHERRNKLVELQRKLYPLEDVFKMLSDQGAQYVEILDHNAEVISKDFSLESFFSNEGVILQVQCEVLRVTKHLIPLPAQDKNVGIWGMQLYQEIFEDGSIVSPPDPYFFAHGFETRNLSTSIYRNIQIFYPFVKEVILNSTFLDKHKEFQEEYTIFEELFESAEDNWLDLGQRSREWFSDFKTFIDELQRFELEYREYNNKGVIDRAFNGGARNWLGNLEEKLRCDGKKLSIDSENITRDFEIFFRKVSRQNLEHLMILKSIEKEIFDELQFCDEEKKGNDIEVFKRRQQEFVAKQEISESTTKLLRFFGVEFTKVVKNKSSKIQSYGDTDVVSISELKRIIDFMSCIPIVTIPVDSNPKTYVNRAGRAFSSCDYKNALMWMDVALRFSTTPEEIKQSIFRKIEIYSKTQNDESCEGFILHNIQMLYNESSIEEFVDVVLGAYMKNSNKFADEIETILSQNSIPSIISKFLGNENYLDEDSVYNLAKQFAEEGETNNALEAIRLLKDKLCTQEKFVELDFFKIDILKRNGNGAEAEEILQEILNREIKSPEKFIKVCELCHKRGWTEIEKKHIKSAILVFPVDAGVIHYCAKLHYDLKEYRESIAVLSNIRDKKNPETYFLMAKNYDELKQYFFAKYYFSRAKSLDISYITPENPNRKKYFKRLKIIITSIISVIILQFILFASGVIPSIYFDYSTSIPKHLYVGEESTVDVEIENIFPAYALDPTDEFYLESDDTSIVSTDEMFVAGESEGTTTVHLMYNEEEYASQEITVEATAVSDVSAQLHNGEYGMEFEVGDTAYVETLVEMNFGSAEKESVDYYSEDTSVATVNEDGKVEAVGVGETNIIVGSNDVEDVIPITVKAKVEDIILKDTVIEVEIGETVPLNYEVVTNPEGAEYWPLEYSYSETYDVLEYDENGNYVATGLGEATITIKSRSGLEVYVTVNVVNEKTESEDTYPETDGNEYPEDFEIVNLYAEYDRFTKQIYVSWNYEYFSEETHTTVFLTYSHNGVQQENIYINTQPGDSYSHYEIYAPTPGDVYEITVEGINCDTSETITFTVPEY